MRDGAPGSGRVKTFFQYLLGVAIIVYALCLAIYAVTGPITFSILGALIRLNDLFTLVFVFCTVVFLRLLLWMTWTRQRWFAARLVILLVAGAMALGELGLRLVFPKEMNPAPYTHNFQAEYPEADRGPYSFGPKQEGTLRVLTQGDSITRGAATPDWQALYPSRLMELLGRSGGKYDMQVWSDPSAQMDWHARILAREGARIKPDIIILQWSVDDMAVVHLWRGPARAPWQKGKGHKIFSGHSLLYRWLDKEIKEFFYQEKRGYARVMGEQYTPGTMGWWRFEKEFHDWAIHANSLAQRTVLLVYPLLPYQGEYPFAKVTQRVIDLAQPHLFKIPASLLRKRVGIEEQGHGGAFKTSRVARVGRVDPGYIAYGPYIALEKGAHQATFHMKLLSPAPPEAKVAKIEVVCCDGGVILGSRIIHGRQFGAPGLWETFTVDFTWEKKLIHDLELRVEWFGAADLALDTIDLPVDYRIEVVDPKERLKTFDTHAELFDSHPNPRAHDELARILAEHLLRSRQGRADADR